MQVTQLKLSWGAAWEEARPYKVRHGTAAFEMYIREDGDTVLIFDTDTAVIIKPRTDGRTEIRVSA